MFCHPPKAALRCHLPPSVPDGNNGSAVINIFLVQNQQSTSSKNSSDINMFFSLWKISLSISESLSRNILVRFQNPIACGLSSQCYISGLLYQLDQHLYIAGLMHLPHQHEYLDSVHPESGIKDFSKGCCPNRVIICMCRCKMSESARTQLSCLMIFKQRNLW